MINKGHLFTCVSPETLEMKYRHWYAKTHGQSVLIFAPMFRREHLSWPFLLLLLCHWKTAAKKRKKNNSICKGFAERGTGSPFLTPSQQLQLTSCCWLENSELLISARSISQKGNIHVECQNVSPSFPVLSFSQASLKPLESVKSWQTWMHKESVISLTFIWSKGHTITSRRNYYNK